MLFFQLLGACTVGVVVGCKLHDLLIALATRRERKQQREQC